MASRWSEGEVWKNPDLARTWRRIVEAEKAGSGKGRQAGLKAARDRFYKGDIAREMAKFSEENGGLFRYEDFAAYTAKVEEPVSIDYRGYTVYKNPSASQGPAELFALNILEGYDLKKMGLNSRRLHPHLGGSDEAGDGRSRQLSGRHGLHQDPVRRPAFEGVRRRAAQADRPGQGSLEFRPGDVTPYAGSGYKPRGSSARRRLRAATPTTEGDTSYIAVVDRDRNMITFTPSLHSAFGTKVVMGDLGFHLQLPRRLLLAGARGTPTRSRPASARAARCKARW